MANLTVAQAVGYAKAAGFSGQSCVTIVAIAMAESNLNTTIVNSIGATGILQILLSAHPDVSSAQAKDPAFSFKWAWKDTGGGKNYCDWQSYDCKVCGNCGPKGWNSSYKQYLPVVAPYVTGSKAGSVPGAPAGLSTVDLKWINLPWFAGNAYATTYKGPGTDTPHYAVDMQTPFHTQITSLVNGIVKTADFQPWGGQVFITGGTGGSQFYVYHLDTISVKVGQSVSIGTPIGLSGGQNSGGSHPISSQWSSGPHTHAGLFTKFVSTQNGTIPYGPNIIPLITALRAGKGVVINGAPFQLGVPGGTTIATYVPLLTQVHNTLTNVPGFYGLALAIDEAEQFPGWIDLTDPYKQIAGVPVDVVGTIRSIGATAADNFVPLVVRGDCIMLGFAILFLLVVKIVLEVGEKAAPIVAAAL